jgi:DNA-binding NtrC family response regulator
MKPTILVVDDEPAQRQLLSTSLSGEYAVTTAANGVEATQLIAARSFDLVITDERMPDMGGIELLRWAAERVPEIPFIILTAYGSVGTAVEAMKLGAQEYLTKPLKSPEELRLVVKKALSQRALRDKTVLHQVEMEAQYPADIVAHSPAMRRVLDLAAQVASLPTTVLLTGESGTGKEVVARFIHRRSQRSGEAFVPVNCAAITETLLESELFGHEKGAFTGAVQSRRGRFELAHQGTLFLDEVGEMSVSVQAKLLRVLQEQQFERLGGTRTIIVDVRIIAATNKDLRRALEDRSFREDLYYRLNVFPIHISPLRERQDDILPLAAYFAHLIASKIGRPFRSFTPEAQAVLYRHEWPGNVREMKNAVERALIVAVNGEIAAADLPLERTGTKPALGRRPITLADIEKEVILEALALNQGERRATAEQLGISLRTLQYRLKDYGIAGND